MSKSPCTTCKKVKWCENKECQKWRTWFLQEWQKFNNYYNKHNCGWEKGKSECPICKCEMRLFYEKNS